MQAPDLQQLVLVIYQTSIGAIKILFVLLKKEDCSKNPSVFQLIETDEDVPEGAFPSYDSELPFPLDDIGGVYAFKGYSLTNYNSIEECQEAIENAIEAYQNGEGDEVEVIYELVPVDEDITYIIYNEIEY